MRVGEAEAEKTSITRGTTSCASVVADMRSNLAHIVANTVWVNTVVTLGIRRFVVRLLPTVVPASPSLAKRHDHHHNTMT